ncbi:cuticle protein 19-like [Chironomus tepperi]|uniref:cuticle protein 19-like n=1 Tax=Chironomus tepperi TaxID=113505 RepID=UPI00391F33F1
MNSIKLTVAIAFIAVVSAGSVSYVKRSDGYGSGSAWGTIDGSADTGIWNGEYKGDYYAYPAYKFEYGVNDPHTHDHKSQWEMRDGDVVKGEYTLDKADGTKRLVKYHADGKTGFHAHVERIGHAHHDDHYGYQY